MFIITALAKQCLRQRSSKHDQYQLNVGPMSSTLANIKLTLFQRQCITCTMDGGEGWSATVNWGLFECWATYRYWRPEWINQTGVYVYSTCVGLHQQCLTRAGWRLAQLHRCVNAMYHKYTCIHTPHLLSAWRNKWWQKGGHFLPLGWGEG